MKGGGEEGEEKRCIGERKNQRQIQFSIPPPSHSLSPLLLFVSLPRRQSLVQHSKGERKKRRRGRKIPEERERERAREKGKDRERERERKRERKGNIERERVKPLLITSANPKQNSLYLSTSIYVSPSISL